MKKLDEFINSINEAGRPKKVKDDTPSPEEIVGKPADKNGSHGKFAIDEPTDNDAFEKLDKETMSKNLKRLVMKFKSEEPFFIQGKAGWGKTSLIVNTAKRYKRSVITVYLDKAQATDLEGIPVAVKDDDGSTYQDFAMPKWAMYMKKHKDKNFLLFFDEMNQAAPDVMNALMPIVLKNVVSGYQFENFMVGAAGNFEEENTAGINELSKPLKSRFSPIIIWESGGDEWKHSFRYLHKEWDEKLGKEFIDEVEKHANLFDNPRDVELKLLKFVYKLKSKQDDEELALFDVEDYLERIEGITVEDLDRTERDELKRLAEYTFEFLNAKEDEAAKPSRGRSKDKTMVSDNLKKEIRRAMTTGSIYEPSDKTRYGISRENIAKIFCDPEMSEEPINNEMLERIISKLEADGDKFKFEKDAEFKKAGFADPLEE